MLCRDWKTPRPFGLAEGRILFLQKKEIVTPKLLLRFQVKYLKCIEFWHVSVLKKGYAELRTPGGQN